MLIIRLFQATYDAFRTLLKGSSSGKFGIIDCIEFLQSQNVSNEFVHKSQAKDSQQHIQMSR